MRIDIIPQTFMIADGTTSREYGIKIDGKPRQSYNEDEFKAFMHGLGRPYNGVNTIWV